MKTAKAFAPGNVSCIFSIVQSKNAEKSGSTGVGLTINKGDIVSLEKHGFKAIEHKKPEPMHIVPQSGTHTKHAIIKHFKEVYKNGR